jgi:hypothetical protein
MNSSAPECADGIARAAIGNAARDLSVRQSGFAKHI